MTDHRARGPGESGTAVPRDMPDQQAGAGEDPWEVAPDVTRSDETDEPDEPSGGDTEPDVPDTDEAGTGRKGAPFSGAVNPEQPVPDEPPA